MSSLPIYPVQSPPRLIGIARLASAAEHVASRHEVEFFSLPVRSILNRCDSRRNLPFTWTINPYRGCEFACKYCFARYTHEFMEIRDPHDFEHKIFVKDEAAWLLRRDLRKVRKGEEIAIGTATDPYQPAERLRSAGKGRGQGRSGEHFRQSIVLEALLAFDLSPLHRREIPRSRPALSPTLWRSRLWVSGLLPAPQRAYGQI